MKDFSTITHTDPLLFEKAVDLFEQLNANEELRAEVNQRAKALSDYNTLMGEAWDAGAAWGAELYILKEQGRSEQEIEEIRELAQQAHLEAWRFPDKVRRDAARKLKQYKLPLQLIADSFGLTLAQVKRL